jgi:ribonuclease BN (tRNA processing enzyme)
METRTKLRSLRAILFTALTAQQVSGMPGLLFAMSSLGAAKLAVRGPEGTARYTTAARTFVRRKYPDVTASDIKANGEVVFESALVEVRAVALRLEHAPTCDEPIQTVCYVARFALPILPGTAAAPCFAALLVLDCPTPALLDAAIASRVLTRACAAAAAAAAADTPFCVVHFAPHAVVALPRYAAWLERAFGPSAHHIRLAPRAAQHVAAFRAATTAQAVMHALAPASYVAPPFDAAVGAGAAAAVGGDDGRSFSIVAVGAGVVRGERDAAWRTLELARDRDLEGVAGRHSPSRGVASAAPLLPSASVALRESDGETEVRRVAEDGIAYTRAEFKEYFGGSDEWDAASARVAGGADGNGGSASCVAAPEVAVAATSVALALHAEVQIDVPPIVATLRTATAKDVDALVAHVIAAAREGASAARCAELDHVASSAATRRERRWRAIHTLGGPGAADARGSAAPWAECAALAGAASPDGRRHPLKVVFLGTGAASPSRQRGSSAIWLAACGCTAPGARGENSAMLLDCGEGAYCQLRRCFGAAGIDKALLALQCIWISHAHLDHHMGLVRILVERGSALRREHESWAVTGGVPIARPPLTVIAPQSIGAFLGEWFALPGQRRGAGSGAATPRFRFVPHSHCRGAVPGAWPILPPPFCAIQSVPVVHCPAAFGVVIDVSPCGSAALAAPCRVVYSGDTRPCERLARAGFGATLALHEATFGDDEAEHARRKRHSTVSEACGVARAMRAHALVLTHFSQRRFIPKLSPEAEADPRVAAAFDLMAVPIGLWPLDPAAVAAAGGFGPRWRWCARLPGANGAADGTGGVTIDSALLRALFEGGISTAAVEAV